MEKIKYPTLKELQVKLSKGFNDKVKAELLAQEKRIADQRKNIKHPASYRAEHNIKLSERITEIHKHIAEIKANNTNHVLKVFRKQADFRV